MSVLLALSLAFLPDALFDASQRVSATPTFAAWGTCIVDGAKAYSHGPDAADLIVDAALFDCEAEEGAAMAVVFLETTSREDALQVHAYLKERLRKRGLAVVVNYRATQNISH